MLMQENQTTEFKESWKDEWLQWICGFANRDGGTLYIGRKDDGTVKGISNAIKLAETIPQSVRHLLGIIVEVNILVDNGNEYLEIKVDKYPFPVSYRGKYYLRSGNTNLEVTGLELDRFMNYKVGKTWDGVPYPSITVEDLDSSAFTTFKEKSIKSGRLTKEDLDVDNKTLLEKLNLYENGYLTNAGVLLFHKNPEYYFTGATIKIGYFESNHADLKYQDEITGALIQQVDKAIEMIYSKYLKALIWYDDIQRVEEFMFPREAFREVLLNAVNHKDYARGIPIQVSVYEDMIYVGNDGVFSDQIDFSKIYEKHRSIPYNPKIAGTFFKSGMIESWGRGFEKIRDECEKSNVPLPIVDVKGSGIMIQILPSKKYMELLNGEESHKKAIRKPQESHKIVPEEKLILDYCNEAKNIKEIANYFGYKDARRFKENYINPLMKKGLLEMTIPEQPTNRNQKYISKK